MSVAEAPETETVTRGEPGTADGSPPAGTARATEALDEGGAGDADASTAAGKAGGGADLRDLELARMREQYEQSVAENETHRTNWERLNSDPEIVEFVQRRVRGEEAVDPIEAAAKLFEGVDKDGENPGAWKRSMQKALAAAAKAGRDGAIAELKPMIDALGGSVARDKVGGALSERGVSPEVQKTPAWKAHWKEMGASSAFRLIVKRSPEEAADWAASKWSQRDQSRQSAKSEHDRVERAKGAKLNGSVQRASATSVPDFVSDPRRPDALSKRADWLRANAPKFPGGIQEALAHIKSQRR